MYTDTCDWRHSAAQAVHDAELQKVQKLNLSPKMTPPALAPDLSHALTPWSVLWSYLLLLPPALNLDLSPALTVYSYPLICPLLLPPTYPLFLPRYLLICPMFLPPALNPWLSLTLTSCSYTVICPLFFPPDLSPAFTSWSNPLLLPSDRSTCTNPWSVPYSSLFPCSCSPHMNGRGIRLGVCCDVSQCISEQICGKSF